MIVRYDSETGEIIGSVSGSLSADDFNESVIEVSDEVDIEGKKVDTSEDTLTWEQSLTKAKQSKIREVKEQAQEVLSETDWCVVRKQETGEAIPQDVLDHRSTVRSQSDTFEQEINDLDSVGAVMDYSFEFPDPPE